jgi:hypothetical protein
MDQLTHIGLDVHKDTIAVAVPRPDTATFDVGQLSCSESARTACSTHPSGDVFRVKIAAFVHHHHDCDRVRIATTDEPVRADDQLPDILAIRFRNDTAAIREFGKTRSGFENEF